MKKIKFEKDFFDFFKLCGEHNVKYLLIGGYAVGIHGYPRYTKDIDICIECSEENAERIVKVIEDFGFGSLKLKKEDFLKKDLVTQLGYEPNRIDIINGLEEVAFQNAWDHKLIVDIEGVPVYVIGLNELIEVKTKAARPQDIADVSKLKKRKL